MSDDGWNEDAPVVTSKPPARGGDDFGDDGGSNNERGGFRGRGRGGGRGGRGGGRRNDGDENGDGEDGGTFYGGGGRRFNGGGDGDDNDNGGGERGRGRGRGRGGFRGGRGGGGGRGSGDEGGDDDGDNKPETNGEPEPPKERYIPKDLPEGEELFEERTTDYTGSGINFEAYDDIPVSISDGRKMESVSTFEEMGLRNLVLDNIKKVGYKKPTPIQRHASPVLLGKQDLMACAQTGSGKTAAFLLPIINSLLEDDLPVGGDLPARPQVLIVAPTRELALQIDKEAHMYSSGSILRSICCYGGTAIFAQKGRLAKGCHILVATPGRLKQFLNERIVDLSDLKYFVLDEADRMLDMGFMPDVDAIVDKMPGKGEKVSAMFSATFPEEIQRAASKFLNDYIFVVIGIVGGACKDVEQVFFEIERKEKRNKVLEILNDLKENDKVLIFCGSKKGADFLAGTLSTNNISSTSIHGDRLQSQREAALADFVKGRRKVLVATAVAARGLDIPKVTMVVNYDLPKEIDEYVHRIGRTGRVGHTGKAISFYEEGVDSDLVGPLSKILSDAGQPVPHFFGGGGTSNGVSGGGFGASDHRQGPVAVEQGDEEWND